MGDTFVLNADKRTINGRRVKNLRNQGKIPAVVYGGKKEPQSLTIDAREFEKLYNEAGSSSLIELVIDNKKVNVLAQEPQYNAVTGDPIHVDFIRVRMDEKIKTEVPLEITGVSPAVEEQDGTLITPRGEIEIECLPGDLVSEIPVDISSLKDFDNQIKVSDLKIPSNIEVITGGDEVVALVEPPRSEEELAELDKPTAEEEKEAVEAVAGEEPEEGEEGAEGEESSEAPAGDEQPSSDEKKEE